MELAMTDQVDTRSYRFWPQLRRFLVFQLKLYLDALRDFFISLLSLGAFLLDVLQGSHGRDSNFEKVLELGRRTEKAINLFEHHDPDGQDGASVDAVIRGVEEQWRRQQSDQGPDQQP